ncbi:MAG: class I SAM-dependent methyltransferase, partial [bacterium]|nr:class I SAM-dependent methyltransferase [bacterium]
MTNKHVEKEFDNWVSDGISETMKHNHYFLWERIFMEGNFDTNSYVLDLCCGEGWAALETARKIPDGFVLGVDISSAMVDIATKKRGNCRNTSFFNGDVSGMFFGDEQFSQVYSIEALYYIKELEKTLESVYRALKPGGRFLTAIDYYKENPNTSCWQGQISIPMYNYSTEK